MNHPVQQHPASADAYIRYGWSIVPIPPGTKGPTTDGWNLKQNALKDQTQLPPMWGIGLAHAYSGTMALDLDDFDAAYELLKDEGVDIRELYDAPNAVIIDSGREGRGKLLYAMPFGLVLETKRVTSNGKTIYELRCGTSTGTTVQDVLPPSIHPDTHQPYRWAGRGNWTRLPTIPAELLTLWQGLLIRNSVRVIPDGEGLKVCWDEIVSALNTIPASCDRDEWIRCGMALHSSRHEHAFELWDTWSKTDSVKYPGETEMIKQWRSFKADRSVTLGSLFHIATSHGWVRPPQDYSHLFPPLETSPDELIDCLTPKPPVLDVSLMPTVIARRADEVARLVGGDAAVAAWAGMIMATSVIDARTRLRLKEGFLVPPILWVMVIGKSGDKKSPASKLMYEKLMAQLEQEDFEAFQMRKLVWEGKDAAWSASHKAYLDYCGSPEALLGGDNTPQVLPEPEKPVDLRLNITDVTSQQMVQIIALRPQGVALMRDEMAGWLAKVTDPRSGDDRSAWVVSYEASPYRVDRVGHGSTHAKNFACSIYGNVQPDVFTQYAPKMAQDGMLQRFIPVVSQSRSEEQQFGEDIPEFMQSKSQYESLMRLLLSIEPREYRLSHEADEKFADFRRWFYAQLTDYQLMQMSEDFLSAYCKLEGTCGRIALIMHMCEHPYDAEVGVNIMLRAIAITRDYIVQSLRYTLAEAGIESFDKWVVTWLATRAVDYDSFTLGDLRASARKQLRDMTPWAQDQRILLALMAPEERGFCKRIDDGSLMHAGRAQWALNKEIVKRNEKWIKRIVEAKVRDMQYMYRLSTTGKPLQRVAGQSILEK